MRRTYSRAASLPLQVFRKSFNPPVRYASSNSSLEVFNEHVKLLQRDHAASNTAASRNVDYLRDEIATRLCGRLLDIKRQFPSILDLGANACNIARCLTTLTNEDSPDSSSHAADSKSSLTSRFNHLTSADSCKTLLNRDESLPFNKLLQSHKRIVLPPSQQSPLPFAPQSFDAVLSSLSMHWINDLPLHLSRIADILKPDSPFIGAMLGGDSLYELRTSLQLADLDRRGGVSTHVSPLADVRDIGSLLTRAGFKMLTVDVDDIIVEYPSTFALMMDLQAMGESNAALTRELSGLRKDVLLANEAIYRELHAAPTLSSSDLEQQDGEASSGGREIVGPKTRDGSVPATFRIIYMIGWTPGEGQPQPEKRGSGQINLVDALGGKGGAPGQERPGKS